MPVDWVVAPTDPALETIRAGVAQGSGAVLIGPAGVGKTTLLRLAGERLADAAQVTSMVTATASTGAIPFGAFRDLLDIPPTGKTAAILRAARETLRGRLLLVDDAHQLDPLSATLLHQLALDGTARLVVAVAAGAPAPDQVSSLWLDDLLTRVDLDPAGHDDTRVAAQAEAFVADLAPDARRALECLAVENPLEAGVLTAIAGSDALDAAVAAEAVRVVGDSVRAAHPLFVDAMRGIAGGPEIRRLRTELVAVLAARRPTGVLQRLRLAALALDSDHELPAADLTAAAQEALRLGDLQLSERLARVALQRAGDLASRLALGYALTWQGRGREADAVLADVDETALSDDELMAWALPRAANQFWMLSEPERATAFLRTVRGRVAGSGARITIDALSSTFAMNAGMPAKAMELVTAVLASPDADETAVGWASAAGALSCARMGRLVEVDALADQALATQAPGLLRFTSGFGQTTTHLFAGDLDRAHELARRLTEFAEWQQPGRAIGEVLIADVLIARGELDAAVTLLRDAAATLAPTGYSWGPLAWMLLAQALGQQGATVEAGKALARAESRHGLKSMLFAPELGIGRAWTMAARKDGHGAVAAAREAARSAERGGQLAVALRALHDAVRLGDARAADQMVRLGLDCEYGRLALWHAKAFAAADADGLDAAAAALAGIGMHGAAADAMRQADAVRG
ncbi:AAA family ATPase [Mycobacterium sp. 852013-51886_SCH5428379]|uniref:ATP-binding protein n=1 Tax=Mycobacterium sp. 852013-51886_SCH5428379 TaxID=1834111 RepID=UPI00080211BE|nr:ATP-binding protein [Mycobacterium sp. 852013-51886_SCH5428379]OBB60508.1 AAA family ATPase [Mycobacterium sp. 852013-51886_SCH5428379]